MTAPAPQPDHDHDEVLAAILAVRARLRRRNRARLRRAVDAFTAGAPVDAIRAAIDPTAHRTVRKAQAGLALATALHASGHADAWQDANSDNRADAAATGAAAAAHQVSGGAVPADSRAPAPAPHNPGTDLDRQLDGLAGDLADLRWGDGVTDDDIADALAAAAGVYAYADMQWTDALLAAALALYAELGAQLVDWYCCEVPCGTCKDVIANSPYTIDSAPGAIHPNCEPWVEPHDYTELTIS